MSHITSTGVAEVSESKRDAFGRSKAGETRPQSEKNRAGETDSEKCLYLTGGRTVSETMGSGVSGAVQEGQN